MEQNFDLRAYVLRGGERVAAEVMRATWKNPRESAFLLRFGASFAAAAKRRRDVRARGQKTAGYLTLCLGESSELAQSDWERFFDTASRRGVSVIPLMGAEPLKRTELLEAAGKKQDILFPVFTAAMPGAAELRLFDRCRNLVPMVDVTETRGQAAAVMDALGRKNILFGAFAEVRAENLRAVCADAHIGAVARGGSKGLLLLDGVAGEADRAALDAEISRLRTAYPELLFFSLAGNREGFGGLVLRDTRAELLTFY